MKSTARDLATLLHTAESLRDHGLPTEPVNSHPPWYHCNSQVHKTFFFFFSPQSSLSSKNHFLLLLTRKRQPGEFSSFRSYVTVPSGVSVSQGNWAAGSASPHAAEALRVAASQSGSPREAGRQGKVLLCLVLSFPE